MDLLRQYGDKSFSFCDALSFMAMERLGLTDALAFDEDFRSYGKIVGALDGDRMKTIRISLTDATAQAAGEAGRDQPRKRSRLSLRKRSGARKRPSPWYSSRTALRPPGSRR